MNNKILFVDDEENVLSAFRRQLRGRFEVETARSGKEGLEKLALEGPYAVVVADLRMPGMDGINFLAKARQAAPDTVRIMLTGYADLSNAIEAINEGNIFRFLTKPSPPEHVIKAIEAGMRQHQLITAERDLLEKTLKGSINLLTDVLSTVNPTAFSLTLRIRKIVKQILKHLPVGAAWEVEMAAMLSQVGCVLIPVDILEKVNCGEGLPEEESRLYNAHPMIGFRLLVDIPRLEQVAAMVRDQMKPYKEFSPVSGAPGSNGGPLGAQILKAALDYHWLVAGGASHHVALAALSSQPTVYNQQVVQALAAETIDTEMWNSRLAGVNTLEVGMVLGEDICTTTGELIAARYKQVNHHILERVHELHRSTGIVEPFRVFIPAYVKQDVAVGAPAPGG